MATAKASKAPQSTSERTGDKPRKKVAIALQGGGSHGAYTWGVLDALLEDGRLDIEGVVGTSAGGMNATATVMGLVEGGREGARSKLKELWTSIGEVGRMSPIQPSPMNKAIKNFDISSNPVFLFMQQLNNMFSPYQLNPSNNHPLRPVVQKIFNFEKLSTTKEPKLFLCATHVATGKLKVFSGEELCEDALLASACVPNLFQAIEVKGEFYWDGGFIGNPAIYPLIYNCDSSDIIMIQIRRVHDPKIPTTVHEINNRLGEITQNACLTREMRSIAFITKLIDDGIIAKDALKRLHMHMIRDDAFFGGIDRASGFCADPDFLQYLFENGRRMGKAWIAENYDAIGKRTTAQIEKDFI
ncbi:MAG: patatin-like phospholipase family protein [Holosporales bacterium]